MNDLGFEMDYADCICETCKNNLDITEREEQLDYDIIPIELPKGDGKTLTVKVNMKALNLTYNESKNSYRVSLKYTTKCFCCARVRDFKKIINILPEAIIHTILECETHRCPLTIQSIDITWRDMQNQQNRVEVNAELYCKQCEKSHIVRKTFKIIAYSTIGSLQRLVIDFLDSKIKIQ